MSGSFVRNSILVCAAASAIVRAPQPTFAADLGGTAYEEDDVEPPRCLWFGFYGGVHAGGAFDGEAEYDFQPGVAVAGDTNSIDNSGVIAGGQIGFNGQWGPIVAGIEGDVSFAATENETDCIFVGGVCATQTTALGTIRGRLGATLTPRFLVYGTGGVAFAGVEHSVDFGGQLFEDDSIVDGAVYGGGVEYMHRSGISFGVEYLRYDFEGERFDLFDFNGNEVPTDIELDTSVVRARVNLHFN